MTGIKKIIFLALIFLPILSFSQNVKLSIMGNDSILIGDHLQTYLIIDNANKVSDIEVRYNNLDTSSVMEIVKKGEWEPGFDPDSKKMSLIITSFDAGEYYIPQLQIQYKVNGTIRSMNTRKVPFTVIDAQPRQPEIIGIKDIAAEKLRWYELLLTKIIGGLALLGLLVWLALKFVFKTKEKEVKTLPEIIRPAHEIALEKLDILYKSDYPNRGEFKLFHSELPHIIREYLDNRWDLKTLESTTPEILKSMKDKAIDEKYIDRFKKIFEMADIVKFAKGKPSIEAHEGLIADTISFVQSTKNIIEETEKIDS